MIPIALRIMKGKLITAVLVTALGSLVVASSAGALVTYSTSTATFTKAIATPDWTKTSFAGTINWNSCNLGCKSWLVLIFAEPTVYKCEAEDWLIGGDPNIHQVWNSLGQTGNKTLSFEQVEYPLIPGVIGQRLCVIGIQTTYSSYWETDIIEESLIGQTLLTVYTPPPPPPPPPTLPVDETIKLAVSQACLKARKKVVTLTSRRNTARKEGKTKAAQGLNKALRSAKKARKTAC